MSWFCGYKGCCCPHLTAEMSRLVNMLGSVRTSLKPCQPNSKPSPWSPKAVDSANSPARTAGFPFDFERPFRFSSRFPWESHSTPASQPASHSQLFPRLLRPGNQFQLSSGFLPPRRQGLISCRGKEDLQFGLDPAPLTPQVGKLEVH